MAIEVLDANGTKVTVPDLGDVDFAKQSTLEAVLAALAPIATDEALAAVLAKLSADPATQTTLAAVLAKLNATLSASITNLPADYPATATVAKAEQIRALLAGTLATADAATLAKLEAMRLLLAGTLPVSAASLPLPAGAATQATLASILAALVAALPLPTGAATAAGVSALLTELQAKADVTETQPVSLAAVPLPTGAATSALQTTGNSSLESMLSRLPALGRQTSANSLSIAIASDQGVVPVVVSSGALPVGAATAENQTVGIGEVHAINLKMPALGQAAGAASVPVVLSSDQPAVPVSGTFFQATQPVSGTVAISNQAADPSTNATLTQVRDRLPSTGAASDAKLDSLLTKIDTLLTAQADLLTAIGLQAKLTDAQPITGSISVAADAASNREVTQSDIKTLSDTLLYFVTAILDKMPMLTSTDDARVNVNGGSVAIASGTVTTVTTCGTVTTLANLSGGNTALLPWALTAGPLHIYDNIRVTS